MYNASWKRKVSWRKPGTEHKTPWHVKNASGIKKKNKNVSSALSNVLIHRNDMHTDRILRDSLSQALIIKRHFPSRFYSVQITTMKEARPDELWRKRRKKERKKAPHYFINIHLPKSRTPTIQLNTLQLSKEKRKKLSRRSWRLNMLIINTACKPVNS